LVYHQNPGLKAGQSFPLWEDSEPRNKINPPLPLASEQAFEKLSEIGRIRYPEAGLGRSGTDLNAQNDYDGDGKCDPAVWRDSNGTFYVDLSTSGYTALSANQWGLSGDYPVGSYDTH